MGSIGNPNTWPPYKDCSQGICSIYCPQWCYIIFPPPPPFVPPEDDSTTNFSPLIIAIIGILATAFLLVSYYTIISKYCRRRSQNHDNPTSEFELNHNQISQDNWQVASTGLDESLIKSIAVFKYKRGDGLIEGSTECAVCLNEFQQDESLRLLPKCDHAFHLPCIDKWLRSHSNCPLCRSNVAISTPILTLPSPNSQSSSTLNVSSLEIQTRNDMVLVVPLPFQGTSDMQSSEIRNNMIEQNGQEGVHQQFRRSISLGSFSYHHLIDDLQGENIQSPLKRSISTGRFTFTRHEKGKNSILPN